LTLPSAVSTTPEKEGILVVIDENQRLFVDNTPISHSNLQMKIRKLAKKMPKAQVFLQADKNTPYGVVVRAMDNIRLGGIYDVVLEAKMKRENEGSRKKRQ